MSSSIKERLVKAGKIISDRGFLWNQGKGGNLSAKLPDGKMLIKASGTRLGQLDLPGALATFDIGQFQPGFLSLSESDEQGYADLVKKASLADSDYSAAVPVASMEAAIHTLSNDQFVLHFHPVAALVIAHLKREDPDKFGNFIAKLTEELLVLPFVMPGLALGKQLAKAKPAKIVVLENHGVVISSNCPLEALKLWSQVEQTFEEVTGISLAQCSPAVDSRGPVKVYYPDTAVFYQELISLLAVDESEPRMFFWKGRGDSGEPRDPAEKDIFEIWMATQTLTTLVPTMTEVPRGAAGMLANLPTETLRRNK